jgi:hypothetical protein
MGTLFVDKLDPQSGTSLEIGSSGDTITIPSGATIANSGTATGFGVAGTNSFFVKMAADMQNTADNTSVKVLFDSEIFDTDSVFNTSNNRFVAPAAGKYFFSTSIATWGQNYNAYQVRTSYYINGSENTYLRGALFETSASTNDIANVKFANVVLLNLSANDYVEVYSRSNNPDNSNTITIDKDSTFMGYRIA